jgi:hypothetical protein
MARTPGKPMNMSTPRPAAAVVVQEDPSEAALAALEQSGGMTRTDLGFQQAVSVHKPRDLQKVMDKVLFEAMRMGEDFVYAWRQYSKEEKDRNPNGDGKVLIEGLSIDGAMILARNWGNCACLPQLVQETQSHYLFQASFIDIESGYTTIRLFRQRKSGVIGGKMDEDRKEDITFQIGQSKAIRNAIDKAIPSWMRDEAIEAAKQNAAKKYDPPEKHLPAVVDYAKGLGVTEAQLVYRVGKPLVGWTPYDIVIVRAAFKAIARRESSVHSEFPPVEETEAVTPTPAEPAATTVAGVKVVTSEAVPPGTVALVNPDGSGVVVTPPPRQKTADEIEAEEAERALAAREAAPTAPVGPMFTPPVIPPKGG